MRKIPKLQLLASVALAATLVATGCSALTQAPPSLSNTQEVDRLCKKDGGIKIYETVPRGHLGFNRVESKEQPDGRGMWVVNLSKDGKYRHTENAQVLRPAEQNGGLGRLEIRLWRTSDEKLLGEAVAYITATAKNDVYSCAEFQNKPVDALFDRAIRGLETK